MIARQKKTWYARLHFISTRTLPGPPVVKLHLKLAREPDRCVELELQLEDRRRVLQAIEQLNAQFAAEAKP